MSPLVYGAWVCVFLCPGITEGADRPALSGIPPDDVEAIEQVCQRAQKASGPAAYSDCLERQAAALIRRSSRPDLSAIPLDDLQAIEFVCRGTKEASGPAAYYDCLERRAGILARRSSRPEVSEDSSDSSELANSWSNLPSSTRYAFYFLSPLLVLLLYIVYRKTAGRICKFCTQKTTNLSGLCTACRVQIKVQKRRKEQRKIRKGLSWLGSTLGKVPYGSTFNSRDSSTPAFDPYKELGVRRDATAEEIRTAYLSLMNLYHPDKILNQEAEFQELATRKAQNINRAYEMLQSK